MGINADRGQHFVLYIHFIADSLSLFLSVLLAVYIMLGSASLNK